MMEFAEKLTGRWSGTNQLWFTPDQKDAFESEATAEITTAAQGRFITITYAWSHEGQPHGGVLVCYGEEKEGPARTAWFDSFHTGGELMLFEQTMRDGAISLSGSYPAPEGPDWGWRIQIEPVEADSFTLRMFNIPPEYGEIPAVLVHYRRTGQAVRSASSV
jgi:hypothetical protein